MTGLISDIQRFSLHDGPGIRTTVFFKGCPLNCKWCHNPECISFKPQELFYAEKCIGCGRCSEGCVSGARVICGEEMTVEAVMKAIFQDQPYYGQDGGATFSGGEPLAQKAFLIRMADACHAHNIHTAIETSMIYYEEEALRKMDLIMADLKIWDNAIHRDYTGVPNTGIIDHLKKADELGIPIILRTPVIPGMEQGIPEIADFARSLKQICQYELLPYHPLGNTKRKALSMGELDFKVPSKEQMEEVNQYAFIR